MTDSPVPRYAGMTVNERLVIANLLNDFDEAVKRRDREQMLSVLQKVELTLEQAIQTTDKILANPKYYGY